MTKKFSRLTSVISTPVCPRNVRSRGLDPESAATTIHRDAAKHHVGDRHHLHSHVTALAVSGRRPGSVLTPDRRVGDGADDSPRARAQCRADGGAATPTARHADSFRSGHPVRQRCVAALLPFESPGAEHEPKGQRLGPCRRRIVLQQLEERTDQETDRQEPRPGDRDIAQNIDSFYNSTGVTVISAASARSSSKAVHRPLRKGLY